MSHVVWKQSFAEGIVAVEAELPKGYRLLHAGYDPAYPTGSIAAVWFECDPDEPRVKVKLEVLMTGEEFEGSSVESPRTYVGTVMFNHGIVGHIYARNI